MSDARALIDRFTDAMDAYEVGVTFLTSGVQTVQAVNEQARVDGLQPDHRTRLAAAIQHLEFAKERLRHQADPRLLKLACDFRDHARALLALPE